MAPFKVFLAPVSSLLLCCRGGGKEQATEASFDVMKIEALQEGQVAIPD
jgi:hypothetical protein